MDFGSTIFLISVCGAGLLQLLRQILNDAKNFHKIVTIYFDKVLTERK